MLLDLFNRVSIDLAFDASEALACKFGAELGQHPTIALRLSRALNLKHTGIDSTEPWDARRRSP